MKKPKDLDPPHKLVKVLKGGLFKCVDGRFSDQAAMRGPKALGGVYAIASMRGARTVAELQKIVQDMNKAGKYTPCVHGDTHGGPLGCGYFKLWKTGQLPGLTPPKYDGDFGRAAVLAAGGVYEGLVGSHEESFTVINLKPNTTLEPNYENQRFVLDAWVAKEFRIDLAKYAVTAAETVERLRPAAMHAVIVVP
ncbi:MAG: cadmium-containing carbonic anhydrase [Deltaproteobacteria bacterium]